MTINDAKKRGWTFEIGDGEGAATHPERGTIQVASDTPEAALLVNIAEREGVPTAVGYGLPAEPAAPVAPVQERVAEALRPLMKKASITGADLAAVVDALTT